MRNGAVYLRVDGSCRYWVYGMGLGDSGPLRAITALDPIITGDLSATQAEQLEGDLQYADWQSYDGKHSELHTVGLTSTVFTDGEHEFSCGDECDASGMPEKARMLRSTAFEWVQRLSDIGHGVGGPVRIGTYDAAVSLSDWQSLGYACAQPPIVFQPAAYELTAGPSLDVVPLGSEITSDAQALRQFRDSYRAARFSNPLPAGMPSWAVNVALPVCDAKRVWSLVISDVLEPYEHDGVVPR